MNDLPLFLDANKHEALNDGDIFSVTLTRQTESHSESRKTIRIPPNFQNSPFCIAMIRYLREVELESEATAGNRMYATDYYFRYIKSKYKSGSQIPKNTLALYSNYMSNIMDYSPDSVRSQLVHFKIMLDWIENHNWYLTLPERDRRNLQSIKNNIPSIPKDLSTKPKLALSQLIDHITHDDKVLLDSLNRFCCHLLKIYQEHRETIKNHPDVIEIVGDVNNCKISGTFNPIWNSLKGNLEHYHSIFNAISSSKNSTLQERLLSSNESFREELHNSIYQFSEISLSEKLSRCLWSNGSLRRCCRPILNTLCARFDDLDFMHLDRPSDTEEMLIRWILAADRIQESSQKRITLNDIVITSSHCTVYYFKKRGGHQVRASTAYRKNDWRYKAFQYYKKLRIEFNTKYPNNASQIFLLHPSPFRRIQHINSLAYRSCYIACLPFSHLHSELLTRDPKIQPFLELFTAVFNLNSLRLNDPLINSHKNGTDQNSPVNSRGYNKLTITPGAVSQSRAILNRKQAPTNVPFDRFSREVVDADCTAHSVHTKEHVYTSRSQTVHRVNERSLFCIAVAELMESDARKLGNSISNTKLLSILDMKKVLGWPTGHFDPDDIVSFNSLIASAEQQGYSCTPFGALCTSKSNEKIIIISSVTVALMLSYQDACVSAYESAETKEQEIAACLQTLYIKLTLEKFDHKTLIAGRSLFDTHIFPAPWIQWGAI